MANDYKIWSQYCLSSDSPEVLEGIGHNRIPEPKKSSLLSLYFSKFKDPLIIILCVILVLSCFVTAYEIMQTHQMRLLFEPIGILLAILLSTGIGFIFENRANREFDVRKKVRDEEIVKVIRRQRKGSRPQILSIKKCDVVVGDLIKLEGGDDVPADGHIVAGEMIRIDESAYTGEPYTHKSAEGTTESIGEGAYDSSFLLRGSIVLEGSCYYKVTAVGADTEEGKGEKSIQEEEEVTTPLNNQLDQLGRLLMKASYVIAGLIVVGRLIYYYFGIPQESRTPLFFIEYLLHSVMLAVTLIVVAVPEGLPMSVTVSLALSMRRMLRENNLVRRLHACETMGAATVICTDKTGTLTQNKMTVIRSRFNCGESGIIDGVAVNSTAELSTRQDGSFAGIGNPTEVALLTWIAKEFKSDYIAVRSEWEILSHEPFSTQTKYMSTTARNLSDGRVVKFIKGAPEIILNMCSIANEERTSFENELLDYQQKAMRTLAFAEQRDDSSSPILTGIVGIADPIREGVREAVETCGEAGVKVIMVTGDVATTAMEIGRQLGLIPEGETAASITGTEFASLPDEEASNILPRLRILSRARPEDKARLVSLLQGRGEVVAVTGDGTNDALALKKAQVGLSMGDGTARAKEVSDITILDNSFTSINKAILWGRSLYMNIRRFIVFQMIINICACLVVLVGSFTGIDSPLNVTQMLWVNLIMDTFAAMALSSLPPDKRVMTEKPRDPKSHIINREMLLSIVSVGTIFFIFLSGLWQLLWHTDIHAVADLFSLSEVEEYFTGFFDVSKNKAHMSPYESGVFFSTFVMIQFWNLFNIRYFKTKRSLLSDLIEIIRRRRRFSDCFSQGFLLIAVVILIGQILIVNLAGNFFEVAPLSPNDWTMIFLTTSVVLIVPDLIRTIVHWASSRSDQPDGRIRINCT